VITELAPFSSELLDNHVAALKTLLNDPELSDAQLKPYLAEAVREITSSICAKASPQALLKILKWGINPKRVKAGEIEVDKHRNILELLVNGLYGRLSPEVLSSSIVSAQEFEELVEILATLPGLEKQLAYMRAVLKPVNVQPENQAIGEVKDRDLVTQ
jgi:hypothetical protein